MRIALFGGTFDPIHRGHLALACAAAEAFYLERVLFAPAGRQPLKLESPGASFEDRLAMVALALDPRPDHQFGQIEGVKPDSRFTVSSIDAPHADGSPNYTVDVLEDLQTRLPDAKLFVLSGADSFLDIRRWRSSDRLLALAEWIVVSRPTFSLTEAQLAPLHLTAAQRDQIHFLTTVHEEVSSTELRERLRLGDPCVGLLAPAVAEYIQSHNLYR